MMQLVKHSVKLWSSMAMMNLCFYGCIEPFEAEFIDFESAIVVEATITNEMKQQQVFLTRTFEFEADGPTAESNANVRVIAGSVTFDFEETDPGVYVSAQTFAAQSNTAYRLLIDTQDGRSYSSNEILLTSATQMDEVRAERINNDDGEDGIAILVDSFDPTGNSVNYRYTYEETYRIIAPKWADFTLIPDPEGPTGCEMMAVNREIDDRVCYATNLSNEIILTNTSDLQEDRVSSFMVRFIDRNNYIISHRYTILVRQFIQSNTAFTFYETLAQFSGNESLFSETQPGFLEGNVFSEQNEEEKVLGFFDVASVTEQRIFFNYSDLYPNEPLPPFVDPCNQFAPPLAIMGACILRPAVERGDVRFFDDNPNPQPGADGGEGPFFVVPRVCGACTVLGELEVPEFWTE
ncbi:DUF4249 domain-containing protein [Croceitalea rosinachiae]|uniref:DUF4249 domain-containing protein n=1 Tax=Croceitalea rosinachiae TaxID=3075596 RepID=A0ABU3AD72_9FLAO|nr:DUF4249 domain-containing protein [Croceitalea sp. F388]MDT0607745.1 DUF4249 domain-containing protein [Croceitalea sp. F388]